jgi:hypothetical protein
MKEPEYTEGPKALRNFEQGMKALFKVSKGAIVQAEKKKQKKASSRERKAADKARRGFVFPYPCRFVARRFVFACESA